MIASDLLARVRRSSRAAARYGERENKSQSQRAMETTTKTKKKTKTKTTIHGRRKES